MPDPRPNILFIMSDDHASHAMSCYGSRINRTPHLDRIADGGMRFDNCFLHQLDLHAQPRRDPHRHLQPCQRRYHPLIDTGRAPGHHAQAAAGRRLPDRHRRQVGIWATAASTTQPAFRLLECAARPGPLPRPRDDRNGRAQSLPWLCHRPDHRLLARLAAGPRPRNGPSCSCATTRRRIAPGSRTRNMR